MSLRFNIDQLPEKYRKSATEQVQGARPAKASKYNNQRTTDENGEPVDSKLEAKHIAAFRLQLKAGTIKAYARQVELKLPGNVGMVVDHLVIEIDDTIRFYDSKGVTTSDWRNKQKQALACLGFDVEALY